MSDLTDDELTVLLIADRGESMLPIGRWEYPVKRLVELGYMQSIGGHNLTDGSSANNVITPAGKRVVRQQTEARDNAMRQAFGKTVNGERPAVPPSMTRSDFERVVKATCPDCDAGLEALQRSDTGEWFHEWTMRAGVRTHSHRLCLATNLRNSDIAKHLIDG